MLVNCILLKLFSKKSFHQNTSKIQQQVNEQRQNCALCEHKLHRAQTSFDNN